MVLTLLRKVTGMPLRHPFLHAILGLSAAVLCIVGLVYLADALWRFLAIQYDETLASLIIGLSGMIIALTLVLIISLTSGRSAEKASKSRGSHAEPSADQLASALFQAFTAGREAGQGVRRGSAR